MSIQCDPAWRIAVDARPEAELLLRCARTQIDQAGAERIGDLVRKNIDWADLIQRADYHKVTPLLARSLISTCPDEVPSDVLARLQDDYTANAARNLFLISEVFHLLGLLASRGIPAIVLKGPVLADSIYGSTSLRKSNDLDILVPRKDVLRAMDLLTLEAPQPRFHVQDLAWPESLRLNFGYHVLLVRDDNRLFVELHWELIHSRYCVSFDPERLREGIKPISVAGKSLYSFSSEDLLIYLCLHATVHTWSHICLLCDIAELIRNERELDWGVLLGRARESGTMRILFVGLLLATNLQGASVPEPILRRMRGDARAGSLAREVYDRLVRDHHAFPDNAEWRHAVFLESRERLSDRIRYCSTHRRIPTGVDWAILPPPARLLILLNYLILPKNADLNSIQLPRSLHFLYYLVRPLRLIASYTWRPRRVDRLLSTLRKYF